MNGFEPSTSTLARFVTSVANGLSDKELRTGSPTASHMLPMEAAGSGLLNAGGGLLLEVLGALGPDLLRRLADALEAGRTRPTEAADPSSGSTAEEIESTSPRPGETR